jgi:hypothetical protein
LILLLFMVKPIFARRPKPPEPTSLDPAQEPTLFAFVEHLCAAVGAARPRRIDVDMQVNASAGFCRGLRSMIGNDLVLTIGLPLVAGMTLRQFTGVLAHEFGHFSQGTGMRVTYVIRTVNHWFARVVYERDAWDVRLAEWAKESDLRIGVILHIARFFVWLTRRVLWLLMMVGHAISCFMLRHMEYDADRYEARVAGSEDFEATVWRLQELGAASQQASRTLETSWRTGRLADDLPALISMSVGRLPADTEEAIRKNMSSGRTGAFDTHPADRDRIENARSENSEGIFRLQDPATTLFSDFEALSKRVTASLYRQQLARDVPTANLVPSAAVLAGEEDLQAAMDVVSRYFNGSIPWSPPLAFPPGTSIDPPEEMTDAYHELREMRRSVEEGAAEAGDRNERFRNLDGKANRAAQAFHLIEAGFNVNPGEFGLKVSQVDDATATLDLALAQLGAVTEEGSTYTEAARQRIVLALRLAHHPQARAGIDDVDEQLASSRRLLEALACLEINYEELEEMRREFAAYSLLIQALQSNEATEDAMARLQWLAEQLAGRLASLRQKCDAPYPLYPEKSIGAHAIEEAPESGDLRAIHARGGEAIDRLYELWNQSLASLVKFAAQIEEALGMPPLPELRKEPADDSSD